jgi:putative spermidine/putrescine transport system ATP-binding protein
MIRPETIRVVDIGRVLLGRYLQRQQIGDRQRLVVSGVSNKPLTVNAPNTVQANAGDRVGLLISLDDVRLLPCDN